jgi:hypothetical protein
MIDEVRIYSRALSAEQMLQRYSETKSGLTTSSTLVDTETKTGETWTCQVTPNDGHQDGTAITSNPVSILSGPQVPPVLSNVQVWGNASLSTSRVGSDEEILAIYSYFDENDDPIAFGGSFGTQIRWYRNGTWVPELDNLTSLSLSITAAHEDWTFQIKPGDGHTLASEWYKANNKVIVNSLPEVTDHSPEYGATLNYLALSVNDTQTFSLTCTEMDGDPVTIQWQVNGANAADPVIAYTYPATSTFTWTVLAVGSYTVRARIYDQGYGSSYTTQSWNIVVR